MKFTFFPQPPERPPKKLHLLKKVSKATNRSHHFEITTPSKYCFQIETGELGSNKAVGRIELLTPRPFSSSSNISTRAELDSKPVSSQLIRPLLKQTSTANPRCVFYAPFTPATRSGIPTFTAGLTQFYDS